MISSWPSFLKQELSQQGYLKIAFIFICAKFALERASFLSILSLSFLLGCVDFSFSWNPTGDPSLSTAHPTGVVCTSTRSLKRLVLLSSSGSVPKIFATTRDIAVDAGSSRSSSLSDSDELLSEMTMGLLAPRYCIWVPVILGKSTLRRIGNVGAGAPGELFPTTCLPRSPPSDCCDDGTNSRCTHLPSVRQKLTSVLTLSRTGLGNPGTETGIAPRIAIPVSVPGLPNQVLA